MEKRIADFFKRNKFKPQVPFTTKEGITYYGKKNGDIIGLWVEDGLRVLFRAWQRLIKEYRPLVVAEFGEPKNEYESGGYYFMEYDL